MKDYTYYNDVLQNEAKPTLFLELEAFRANLKAVANSAKGKRVRVASKSIRSVEALRYIFNYSSVFQGVMCFTGEEALYLHEQGFDDLLIAYPIWNEKTLKAICEKVTKGAIITVMTDNIEHLNRLEEIAKQTNGHFLVCIDIDLSTNHFGLHFGVHRSPLKGLKEIKDFIDIVYENDYFTLDGVMGYEAQIAGVTDADPRHTIKNTTIRNLKKQSRKEIISKRKKIMKYIKKYKIDVRFINGGGTGSLHDTATQQGVTEVTVGSGFYCPHLFDKYDEFKLQPALFFALEITRKPAKDIYTCFGGGYIASGAVGEDKWPEIYAPEKAKFTANEGAGEVQTPIVYKGKQHLNLGDIIIFRHSKAGEICERFHEIAVIDKGKILEHWETYRGDGQCFL